MNVLMINDYGSVGGASFYVNNLSRELSRMGHDVLFVSSDQYDGKIGNNSHEFKAVSGGEVGKALGRFNNSDAVRVIRRLGKENDPDVVHVHCFFDQVTPGALLKALPPGLPVVVTLHDDNFTHPLKKHCVGEKKTPAQILYGLARHKIIMKFFRCVNVFISPSEYMAGESKKLGHVARVVTNGVPIKPSYTKPKSPDLLYVGRVDPDKGVLFAVEAMKILVQDYPALKLTIVGDGSELLLLKAYVKAFNLNKNVLFAGYVDSKKLAPYYKACGIVVVPSICQDNQPTTILEASCYGRAVVASDVGGIHELIFDGINGLRVKPGDAVEIVKAIEVILKDKKYVWMGEKAFRNANLYSMKENAKKVIEIYKEVLR